MTDSNDHQNKIPSSQIKQGVMIQKLPLRNAWRWILDGFYLFKENPVMWVILLIIYLLIMIPLSMVPFIGSIISTLLAPVFAAGMMLGCRAMRQQQDLEINHLFAGFKHQTSQLVAVGGIYMVSLMLAAVLVVLALDKETVDLLTHGQHLNPEQASGVLMPILIALLFLMPIIMAYWFAPVLVALNNYTAIEAMKISFAGCLKNMWPFLAYGLIFMMVILLALIPFGLGLIVAVPVMMTSLYVSYEDIFKLKSSND